MTGYFGYVTGNYLNFELRLHEYVLNNGQGTGIGSPFAQYVSEGIGYSGLAPSGILPSGFAFNYINKYNKEYQLKLFAFTNDSTYLTGVPFTYIP